MVEFKSVYSDFISQYISFKRSLGYKYKGAEFRFRIFDRFAVQENCTQIGFTKNLFEKWMEPTSNESESNRYRRVNELINFSRFLRQHRVYRDKKIAKGRRRARKAKRGRATPIFCSEQTIIRPRDQNAYQRDRGLQEQTKNSI